MHSPSRRSISIGIAALASVAGTMASEASPRSDYTRSAGGLTVYFGIMPAEIIRGHPLTHPERQMHGGPPAGPHQYHLIVSIFDTASGARISDATVTAKLSGLGLAGSERILEPMQIAGTTTYGAFVYLPGMDLYTIALTINRPALTKPVTVELKYDHRRN